MHFFDQDSGDLTDLKQNSDEVVKNGNVHSNYISGNTLSQGKEGENAPLFFALVRALQRIYQP